MAVGRRVGQRFDADHEVTTEATIFLGKLDPEALGESLRYATHYEPTPLHEFEALMEMTTIPAKRATFVDLGAGMGRVVLLAANRPFERVIGVDFSPAMCRIARDNIARYKGRLRCSDVKIVRRDASTYALPKGDLIVYLFNPFRGPVLTSVVKRLARHDGELNVIYHTPLGRRTFECREEFEIVGERAYAVVYRKARR
jgi:SAM-dependent methyltransferase